jgi:hypothetical protein
MSGLENIVGLRVNKASQIHDYHQINFDGGWILSIYNPHTLDGKISDFKDLAGLKVSRSTEDNMTSRIEFSDGTALEVKLDEEAYGDRPEAMELAGPKNEMIVWRFGE